MGPEKGAGLNTVVAMDEDDLQEFKDYSFGMFVGGGSICWKPPPLLGNRPKQPLGFVFFLFVCLK